MTARRTRDARQRLRDLKREGIGPLVDEIVDEGEDARAELLALVDIVSGEDPDPREAQRLQAGRALDRIARRVGGRDERVHVSLEILNGASDGSLRARIEGRP